jgi:predicted ATPase
MLRVKALALLRKHAGNAAVAEPLLQQSLDTAREQGALSGELRTATSLARLRHEQGRTPEAYDLLASVHTRSTEGFTTVDLIRARSLLDDMTFKGQAVRRA